MKYTFIGAGSPNFTTKFVGDILLEKDLKDTNIQLMDINPEKLELMHKIIQNMIDNNDCEASVSATTDRRKALKDSDVVIATIRSGEYKHINGDSSIPKEFGMRQTVADTNGPGGAFYALRNVIVLQDICKDMEDVCPDALFLNYTNPMAINMSVLQRFSPIESLGLCHSVQGTLRKLSEILDIPQEEVTYLCGGVNHTAWFWRFEYQDQDMYPKLHELIQDKEIFDKDPVRFDLMKRFHYFPTESSKHHSEYHPYYIKNDEECDRLNINKFVNFKTNLEDGEFERERMKELREMAGREKFIIEKRSREYLSGIIKGYVLDEPVRVYGSILNDGLVDNLPSNCAVEVPIYVDRNGFNPTPLGVMPGGAGARTAAVGNFQVLVAEGILQKNLKFIREAILVDPNTSATLQVDEIEKMTDALIERNKPFLDGFIDPRI